GVATSKPEISRRGGCVKKGVFAHTEKAPDIFRQFPPPFVRKTCGGDYIFDDFLNQTLSSGVLVLASAFAETPFKPLGSSEPRGFLWALIAPQWAASSILLPGVGPWRR
ncbi:MAG: hypothetical protein ACYTDE_10155, partial [Planctomycetota bacterium]